MAGQGGQNKATGMEKIITKPGQAPVAHFVSGLDECEKKTVVWEVQNLSELLEVSVENRQELEDKGKGISFDAGHSIGIPATWHLYLFRFGGSSRIVNLLALSPDSKAKVVQAGFSISLSVGGDIIAVADIAAQEFKSPVPADGVGFAFLRAPPVLTDSDILEKTDNGRKALKVTLTLKVFSSKDSLETSEDVLGLDVGEDDTPRCHSNLMEMEKMEAMDEALTTPGIVEKIVSSFLDDYRGNGKSLLKCRLINKYWDAEALRVIPKKKGLYLNVGTYMGQKYSKEGALLPNGSQLGTRVFVGGEGKDPKDFLLSFRSLEGRETEALFLDNHFVHTDDDDKDKGLTWGGALHEVLKNNLAPKLRELTIKYFPYGRVNNAFDNGDTDFTEALQNLRTLVIRCSFHIDGVVEGSFTPFVRALLEGARDLEKLVINWTIIPLFSEPAEMAMTTLRNLKVLELILWTVESSWIPEIERFLRDVSTNCQSLESLSLIFGVEEEFEGVISFPRFPSLKVFTCQDINHLPLDGDLTQFLREKMPLLRSLIAADEVWNIENEAEVFWQALHSSKGTHTGLKFLSIGAPSDPTVLQGLQTKLPFLKWLDLHAMDGPPKGKSDADWLTELALALALAPNDSLYSSILFRETEDGEKVREMFLAKVGPEWKGTFRLYKGVIFSENQIQLLPRN